MSTPYTLDFKKLAELCAKLDEAVNTLAKHPASTAFGTALAAEKEIRELLFNHRAEVLAMNAKIGTMARLLIDCRDALPAISLTAARLHNVPLDLDTRIERELEPWEIKEDAPQPEPKDDHEPQE